MWRALDPPILYKLAAKTIVLYEGLLIYHVLARFCSKIYSSYLIISFLLKMTKKYAFPFLVISVFRLYWVISFKLSDLNLFQIFTDKLLKERLEIDSLQEFKVLNNRNFYTKFIKVKTKL